MIIENIYKRQPSIVHMYHNGLPERRYFLHVQFHGAICLTNSIIKKEDIFSHDIRIFTYIFTL